MVRLITGDRVLLGSTQEPLLLQPTGTAWQERCG